MSIKRKSKEMIPNAKLFQDVSPVIRNDDSGVQTHARVGSEKVNLIWCHLSFWRLVPVVIDLLLKPAP